MDLTKLTPAQLSHAAFCGQITYADWDAEDARRASQKTRDAEYTYLKRPGPAFIRMLSAAQQPLRLNRTASVSEKPGQTAKDACFEPYDGPPTAAEFNARHHWSRAKGTCLATAAAAMAPKPPSPEWRLLTSGSGPGS